MKITDEELIDELKQRLDNHKKSINDLEYLTQQLTKVNEKLNQSEALKSHFISNITNELVAPFTSVWALSQEAMLLRDKDYDEVKSIVSMINTEMFYLNMQLRNISAAAKIEAGEVDREMVPTNINALINNMIAVFQMEITKNNLSVSFEPISGADNFTTDVFMLKLILSNLISNAVKFNKKENGSISITAKIENHQLTISVKDTGIGIAENFKDDIFDRFTKSEIQNVRGQGLGLSIVRAFLDLLNGNIYFESEQNVGSRFIITIPECLNGSNNLTDDNEFSSDEGIVF